MCTKTDELSSILSKLKDFNKARDWEKYHSPKNLSAALSAEAGELLEIFQWMTEEKSYLLENNSSRQKAQDEIADVFVYLLLLSNKLGIDLIKATNAKIAKNALKYPLEIEY